MGETRSKAWAWGKHLIGTAWVLRKKVWHQRVSALSKSTLDSVKPKNDNRTLG